MATSLAVPVAYITVLVTSLAIFSRVYRKRKAAEKTAYDSWFPPHPARDVYISLLSSPTPVPESLIKSALLVRASADVKRIWRLREDKMALTSLHQRGLLGDETLARFEAAEKELEAEIVDVVQEANTFRQGWGGMIFATATEMAQAERTREVVINIGKVKAEEDKKQARRRKHLPESAQAGPSTTVPAIRSGSTTPSKVPQVTAAPAASITATPTASSSGSASRSTSPGPEASLAASAPGSSASTPAGTPSKSTPSKKKKGKKSG